MKRCLTLAALCLTAALHAEFIGVAAGNEGFAWQPSGTPFQPWGVNYGNAGRLMEDFWDKEWPTLVKDFHNIKDLGANVVRVHLQFSKFMKAADNPDAEALTQLKRLLTLAEDTGLYLDVTGLACYRTADVPAWYDAMDERARWAAQCVFWKAVADVCKDSKAIFCYDLMNEPMVPGDDKARWYSGKTLGGYDFLQSISRTLAGRQRTDLAALWIDTLSKAIRGKDRHHMITVGMLPWVKGWGHLFGFVPKEVAPHVDFLSIHLYPDSKKPDEVRKALSECAGHHKPVVIEETFPLGCTVAEHEAFLRESKSTACGWVWHYDGSTPRDYAGKSKQTLNDAIWKAALESFVRMKPELIAKK